MNSNSDSQPPVQKRELDEQEEMPLAEKDLGDDAAWKVIQKNTFTRWCNEHLKTANKQLTSLETDLSDGLRLIALIEVLSQKKIGRFNKRPTMRPMKLENVSVALKFLEDEHIKIVNIDSGDIVGGKLKLILGLIWTLILHYSISMPMWEDEDQAPSGHKQGPKERLLNYVNSKLPDYPVRNLTTDWNNGKAIGALVDAHAPGLCPDWEDYDPKKPLENAREAMKLAEEWLDIPQVLRPEDMVNPKVDDLSMMTYLSKFPGSKVKPGAPLRPRTNAKKVRAYGPGIEPEGNYISKPTHFTVETYSAGSGKVEVLVLNPQGKEEECKITFNNDRNKTYTVVYTPRTSGCYQVTVKFSGMHIPKSPFSVDVSNMVSDPSKCSAKGPGLAPTGLVVGQTTHFEIFTAGAGAGNVQVTIQDPENNETVECKLEDKGQGVFYCEYTPVVNGNHTVNVTFANSHIPGSAFPVRITPVFNPKKAYATGRGVQPKGIRTKEDANFTVHTADAGDGDLKVQIIGPGGVNEPAYLTNNKDGTYTAKYRPLKPGRYIINVTYSKEHIKKSPFTIQVDPEPTGSLANVKAYGPGLEGGVVGHSCDFTVETNGAVGALGFSIEGPSEAEIRCTDNGDGSCEVQYFPNSPGEYAIHVTCDEQDIIHSPYMANVVPATSGFDTSKVKVYGKGVEKEGVELGKETQFTVDAKNAGKAPLRVAVHDQSGSEVPVEIKDHQNGTYTCTYTPTRTLKHSVSVTWGQVGAPKSPFRINVGGDPSRVKVYGPGVEKDKVKSNTPTNFTVDCKQSGRGTVVVTIKSAPGVNGPKEKEVKSQVVDNKDGTYTVSYTPEGPGNYTVTVTYNGKAVPASPVKVNVVPAVDVSKVFVDGLESKVTVGVEQDFDVITAGAGQAPLKVDVTTPSGKHTSPALEETVDGYAAQYTPTEAGPYAFNITYGDLPIPGSPFKVSSQPAAEAPLTAAKEAPVAHAPVPVVEEPLMASQAAPEAQAAAPGPGSGAPPAPGQADVSKVKVYGPGLKGGHVNKLGTFTVETGAAGNGALGLTIEGPCEADIQCRDIGGGACTVDYVPTEVGDYNINVLFAEQHAPGSPFAAKVFDASKVKADGPGLEPGKVAPGEPADIEVDCRQAGEPPLQEGGRAPLTCSVQGPAKKPVKVDLDSNDNGTYDLTYYPIQAGPHQVDLQYGGYPVAGFPKSVPVSPPGTGTGNMAVYGPGVEPDGVTQSKPTSFTVDAKKAGPVPKGAVKCQVTAPNGKKSEAPVKDNGDSTYTVGYTPAEKGPYSVDVSVLGQPVAQSPYKVGVVPAVDAGKVKVYGPGLKAGHTNQPCQFTVDTKEAGPGGLGVSVEGPAEAQMTCKDNKDGTCMVEYLPVKPGEYDIAVNFADKPVPGSPFKAKVTNVVDPSKVRAHGPGLERAGVRAGVPANFTVDATKAGTAPLECTIIPEKGPREKAKIKDNGDGTFDCEYYPKQEGKTSVEVKYGGQNIPQSPFSTKILPAHDASKVKVLGPGVEKTALASFPIEFLVDTRDAGDAELTITITDQNGKPIKPSIIDNGDGTYKITYTPTDVGRYTITVKYGGEDVPASPWNVRSNPTGDASKVHIVGVKSGKHDIPLIRRLSSSSDSSYSTTSTTTTTTTTTKETITKTVTVHEETVIKVNSDDAGKGRVTATVTAPDGTDIGDVQVIDNGDGTFDIVWSCPATGNYTLDIKFGGVAISGGPFRVQAKEGPPHTDVDGMAQEMKPFDLIIPVTGISPAAITSEVRTPSGRTQKPAVVDNGDGTISIKYSPTEKGLHELSVKHAGHHIAGSPFQFNVEDGKTGQVAAYGPGLSQGIVGEPSYFTINTRDAGAGGLALAVEGPSKAEIKCVDNKDGTCDVSYFPTKPGDYSIIVKFADKHVPGSPFTAKITDPMGRVAVGTASEVPLKIQETDLNSLTSSIRSPSGFEEPCQLKRLPNGNIGISFTPHETGEHLVSVKKHGRHVTNSPFKITVGSQEIGDSSKVKVSGPGISQATAGRNAEFTVDTKNAGYGGLGVSVEGPSKADINCEDGGDGTCTVSYRPTEPGNYILNVKYNDQHVPGSPFKVKVQGEGSNKIRETITRQRQATTMSSIGSDCKLGIKIPGTDPLDMTAQVTNPLGQTEDAEIIDGQDCTYTVRFIPTMMGVHTISIKHRGIHVAGSPFQFTVGPLMGEGGAHKVRAGGPGLERGEAGQPAEFTIWTHEAGPGSLAMSVEGPAKAEIDFEDRKDGSCQVAYHPTAPGEYVVNVKYNDEHIPDSPFKVFVSPSVVEARQLSISSLQESGLKVNQPVSFAINLNGVKGDKLEAKVFGPSGTEEECVVHEIDEDNYAVRFLPRENGIHLVHVTYKGAHIPSSPFRIRVGTVEGDPGLVHASGPGLEGGKTGELCEFTVNTCGAGSGALSITIDGPSKVKMDVVEVPEGYKCNYVPLSPGDYLISIKYAGAHHIVGSPFKAKITGPNKAGFVGMHETSNMIVETITKTTSMSSSAGLPQFTSDASKVATSGMGLKKAFLNKKAQFQVNTSEAGFNMLIVGVAGPKTPCEEVLIKHNGRNRYTVSYTLKEKGDYILVVKYGDEHVPGSPFHVHCA